MENEVEKAILAERSIKSKHIHELWSLWSESSSQTLVRITSYLFFLNTGALAGSLTYIAAKPPVHAISIAIWFFSVGTICSLLHATIDYYLTEKSFASFRNDVRDFYDGKLSWSVLIDRNEHRPGYEWLLHLLGWVGGLAFIVGLFIGIRALG
jgi:hypothetical protein